MQLQDWDVRLCTAHVLKLVLIARQGVESANMSAVDISEDD